MNWKRKALIQNAISILPSSLSYDLYYWLQRNFGGLKVDDPMNRFAAGIKTWNIIKGLGYDPKEKTFFEVGTGRVPVIPLAYWLMGAHQTITVDLNIYLKPDLISECINQINNRAKDIEHLFGDLIVKERLDNLLSLCEASVFSIDSFLDLTNIRYLAPCDASQMGLDDNSVDFHTSFTVFEHIPYSILQKILKEGNRIVKSNGLFVHQFDYSDHFSHSDSSISPINFLQYSDSSWAKYASNRYMYMNRIRHDDFISILHSSDQNILVDEPFVNSEILEMLESKKFEVHEKFKSKSNRTLAITSGWTASQRKSVQQRTE
jgi:SAM-dependent methyltransferase